MKPFGKSYSDLPEDIAQESQRVHMVGLLEGKVVATASVIDKGLKAWLRSVTVVPALQSQGIGGRLLQFVDEYVCKQGYQEVYCYARDTAVNFYLKNGWHTQGDYYELIGISHITMTKKIVLAEVRRLVPQEWQVWKAFRLAALQESPGSFAATYQEEAAYTDKEWEHFLQTSTVFGLFKDDQLVGCVGFAYYTPAQKGHRGYFFGMYVLPIMRGTGAASLLLRSVIAYAKNHVIQLQCAVKVVNERAVGLYKKHGFTQYGIEPRALKTGDTYYDDALMVLFLD